MSKITEVRFIPITQRPYKGHVGYVNFVYEDTFILKDIAVYELLNKKGYRLVFPKHPVSQREFIHPFGRKVQEELDQEVTIYLRRTGDGRKSTDNVA